MLCKVTHCAGRVLDNTRPHQLCLHLGLPVYCISVSCMVKTNSGKHKLQIASQGFPYRLILCQSVSTLFPACMHAGNRVDTDWHCDGQEHKGYLDLNVLRESCYSASSRAKRKKDTRPLVAVSSSRSP